MTVLKNLRSASFNAWDCESYGRTEDIKWLNSCCPDLASHVVVLALAFSGCADFGTRGEKTTSG